MHSYEELLGVVKVLNEQIWEGRLSGPIIDRWLSNFDSDEERKLALHLLAQFMYFGQRELRELLTSLYRDLYRRPLLERIRAEQGASWEFGVTARRLEEELECTRFLGMGNPAESGTHLLYYFRQQNSLSKGLFLNAHEIFRRDRTTGKRLLRYPEIKHYVFIDDLCGSGTQARQYSEDVVEEIKEKRPDALVCYYSLFGLEAGLDDVRANTAFDFVDSVFVLDQSFRCFSEHSRYYLSDEQAEREECKNVMQRYGEKLFPRHGLGYKNSQLLLGFFHNIPDNTLPVIWSNNEEWAPLFRRYEKKY